MNRDGVAWPLAAVLAIIVVASACADSNSSGKGAAVTVTSPTGSATTDELAFGCRLEEGVDEYGFRVVDELCEDETTTPEPGPTDRAADVGAYLSSVSADVLAAGLRDRVVMQSGCASSTPPDGDPPVDRNEIRIAIETLPTAELEEQLVSILVMMGESDQACDDPTEWSFRSFLIASALDEFQLAMSGLDPLSVMAGVAYPEGDPDRVAQATASILAGVNDQVFHVLTARRSGIDSSELWFSAAHLGHLRGVRALAAFVGAPEVVTIGSSVVALDIDPGQLQDEIGQTTVNTGLVGASLEEQIVWATGDLRDAATPDTVIWGVTSRPFNYCPADTLEDAERIQARADAAFSGVASVGSAAKGDRLLGPAVAPTYPANRFTLAFDALYPTWEQGTYVTRDSFNQDAADAQRGGFSADPTGPCEEEHGAFERAVAELIEAGTNVIVVAMPVPDTFRSLRSDAAELDRQALDRLATEADAAGAAWLDLSRAAPDEDFIDLVHLGASGRTSFTTLLAAAVAPLL
ncbi:MAG: hypothetical protein ACR2QE_17555 [Acidimicrobiales bacterium]